MKAYILLIASLFFSISISGQVDTVLFQDFQTDVFQIMDIEPTGDNVNWINYDEDGLSTNLGTQESMQWYGGEANVNALDSVTGETNFVAISSSFLENFLPGNRNWMVLSPQEIIDDTYMLHWKSAPGQLPRYMDGYQVLISTTTSDLSSFTDTLFTAASMDAITGDGQSTDYSNFTFTPGYLHADGGTNTNYFVEGTGIYFGILEPHSVSLASYVGQTVYIAFLHDSDDDERIQIDDILLTKASDPSALNEYEDDVFRMELYPNPAHHDMFLNFQLDQSKIVSYSIYDTQGKLVFESSRMVYSSGLQTRRVDLESFSSGHYILKLNVEGKTQSLSFMKK